MTIKPAEFLGDTIEVLRAFPDKVQKKAQDTSQKDIKLARKRYKELMRTQP